MTSRSHTLGQPKERRTRYGQPRLLKNGTAAHEFTHEDRAKGGRASAEKMLTRQELRERFEIGGLEDLGAVIFAGPRTDPPAREGVRRDQRQPSRLNGSEF